MPGLGGPSRGDVAKVRFRRANLNWRRGGCGAGGSEGGRIAVGCFLLSFGNACSVLTAASVRQRS